MIIDILDWDLTYTALVEWVAENDIVLDAINGYGGGASTKYTFQDEEDFVAFKLKFARDNRRNSDAGFFYAPYIPLMKNV